MKIGLISDTHIPGAAKEPPTEVALAFAKVDLILHAGDISAASCLDWLERIAPVQAVELSPSFYWDGDARVAERRVLELEGHAIGLVHDLFLRGMSGELFPGVIAALFPPGQSLSRALREFFGREVDIVVFGHTHVPLLEEHQRILLINPGSATLPRHIRKLGTVAILELAPQSREARLIDLAGLSHPTTAHL